MKRAARKPPTKTLREEDVITRRSSEPAGAGMVVRSKIRAGAKNANNGDLFTAAKNANNGEGL